MTEQAAPKRIEGLDALRGFALWGICVVNLPLIARSWDSYRQMPETAMARAALFANSLLFEAKFFTLFSFLFGIGIAVLQHREGTAFLVRRFLGLILLGFVHAVLLFPGGIFLSLAPIGQETIGDWADWSRCRSSPASRSDRPNASFPSRPRIS